MYQKSNLKSQPLSLLTPCGHLRELPLSLMPQLFPPSYASFPFLPFPTLLCTSFSPLLLWFLSHFLPPYAPVTCTSLFFLDSFPNSHPLMLQFSPSSLLIPFLFPTLLCPSFSSLPLDSFSISHPLMPISPLLSLDSFPIFHPLMPQFLPFSLDSFLIFHSLMPQFLSSSSLIPFLFSTLLCPSFSPPLSWFLFQPL